MSGCKHFDAGWCYHPEGKGACVGKEACTLLEDRDLDKTAWEQWMETRKEAVRNRAASFEVVKPAKENKYNRTVTGKKDNGEPVHIAIDVYDVIAAWGVKNPALQHLIKKALQCGERGHKDAETDLQDIIDSAVRAKELEGY